MGRLGKISTMLLLFFGGVLFMQDRASAQNTYVFEPREYGSALNIGQNNTILTSGDWDLYGDASGDGDWYWGIPGGFSYGPGQVLIPGNPNDTHASLTRIIDVSSEAQRIDSDQVRAEFIADIGSWGNNGDRGRLSIVPLDENKQATLFGFGRVERPGYPTVRVDDPATPINEVDMSVSQKAELVLPYGTRYLEISMEAYEDTPEDGDNLDAYFRNVWLRLYDDYPPVLRSMTTNLTSGGHYKAGTVIDFYAEFNEPVHYVDGSLTLNIGTADYVGGTGTDTLQFRFTVPEDAAEGLLQVTGWSEELAIRDDAMLPNMNWYTDPDSASAQSFTELIYIDTTPPAITGVGSETNSAVYRQGMKIDVRLTFSEEVYIEADTPPSVAMNTGGTAVYVGKADDPKTLVFQYTVRANDNIDDLDIVQVNGTLRDAAGHAAPLTFAKDGSGKSALAQARNIQLDTTPPALSFTKEGNPSDYKQSHSVVVSATDRPGLAADAIRVYYQWTASASDPANWASIGNDHLLANGAAVPSPGPISGPRHLWVRAIDDAYDVNLVTGNEKVAYGGAFHFDHEPPAVTFTGGAVGAAAQSFSVTFQVSDAYSGVDQATYLWVHETTGLSDFPAANAAIDGSGNGVAVTPETIGEGGYKLRVTAVDKAGNSSIAAEHPVTFVIDRTAPTIAFDTPGHAVPAKSRTSVVTLSDTGGGTVHSASYLWSNQWLPNDGKDVAGDSWTAFGALSGGSVTTPADAEDGTWYLYVKASDSAGNVRYAHTNEGFLLDNSPPAVVIYPNGNEPTDPVRSVQAQLTLYDPLEIADVSPFSLQYAWLKSGETPDGATMWSNSTDGKAALSGVTGAYVLHVRAADQAGNAAQMSSSPYYLDNSAPVRQMSILQQATNQTTVTLQFSVGATDTETGEVWMTFSPDGLQWNGEWVLYAPSLQRNIPNPAVEGTQTFYARFKDGLDNVSEPVQASFLYDRTAPTMTTQPYDSAPAKGPVTVAVTLHDNFTPQDQIVVTQPANGALSHTFVTNGSFTFQFSDLAGNTGSHTVTVSHIDHLKPAITLSTEGMTSPRKTAAATVTAVDQADGISAVSANEALRVYAVWSQDGAAAPVFTEEDRIASGAVVSKEEGDGYWYLWVKAVDEAGHETVRPSQQPFLLDNTPPTGAVTYNTLERTANPVTATLQVTDSSPVEITMPASGANTYTFTDNGTFTFQFRDAAGNTGEAAAAVHNIDTSLPEALVTLSSGGKTWAPDEPFWTNQPVQVTINAAGEQPRELFDIAVTSDALLVSATVTEAVYEFANNGRIDFKIRDLDTGLVGSGAVVIDQIDTLAPMIQEVVYSTTEWTNQNVTVTVIVADEAGGSGVFLQEGEDTRVFTENGTYLFEFQDRAGNQVQQLVTVGNIDKEAPVALLQYSHDSWTQEEVTVTLAFDNETQPVTILNNQGSNRYTFKQNGSFAFEFEDAAGNRGTAEASVGHIDREKPQVNVRYMTSGGHPYDPMDWTHLEVTAELIGTDNSGSPLIVLNNGGSHQYTFSDNGTFTFQVQDAAGNAAEATAVVTRIDKKAPTVTIKYSLTQPTTANVRALLSADEPVTVLNNGNRTEYVFQENGTFVFEVEDRAGNRVFAEATVNHIDRTPPNLTVAYSTSLPTGGPVVATVSAVNGEPIYVLNNARKKDYVFYENGAFTFIAQDAAGNQQTIEAVVDYIDTSKATITLDYSETNPTQGNVTVTIQSDKALTILNNGAAGHQVTFTENGVRWILAKDEMGNEYAIQVPVSHIDRTPPVLRFEQGDRLLVPLGSMADPLADVSAIDNLDGDLTGQVTAQHQIDAAIPGEYDIVYTVTDRAGNETAAVRKALVFATGDYRVFVNALPVEDSREVAVRGSTLSLQLFGEQGEAIVKWAYGKLGKGDFKRVDSVLAGDTLTVDRNGYYTFYIQDQERRTMLIHVYVYRY